MDKKIVVVLGYGCEVTSELLEYLQQVACYVEENRVDNLILSGGFTSNKKFPGISEAAMMKGKLLLMGVKVPIILDEFPITTLENLRNLRGIKEMIEGSEDADLVIFCDRSRALKVSLMSRIVLGWFPELRKVEITRKFSSKLKQLLLATPLDVLATIFPKVEMLQLKRKEWIIERN